MQPTQTQLAHSVYKEIFLTKDANYNHLTACAHVGLALCLCGCEIQILEQGFILPPCNSVHVQRRSEVISVAWPIRLSSAWRQCIGRGNCYGINKIKISEHKSHANLSCSVSVSLNNLYGRTGTCLMVSVSEWAIGVQAFTGVILLLFLRKTLYSELQCLPPTKCIKGY